MFLQPNCFHCSAVLMPLSTYYLGVSLYFRSTIACSEFSNIALMIKTSYPPHVAIVVRNCYNGIDSSIIAH